MWKKYPNGSGFYWFFYIKENSSHRLICQYEKISRTVVFIGNGSWHTLEQLDFLNGQWLGPLDPPENPQNGL